MFLKRVVVLFGFKFWYSVKWKLSYQNGDNVTLNTGEIVIHIHFSSKLSTLFNNQKNSNTITPTQIIILVWSKPVSFYPCKLFRERWIDIHFSVLALENQKHRNTSLLNVLRECSYIWVFSEIQTELVNLPNLPNFPAKFFQN